LEAIPLAGHLSERFGRKRIYLIGSLAAGIFGRRGHRRPRYICGDASQTVAALAKRLVPARLFELRIADHYAARASRCSSAGAS
jgi:MFS family permease